jgi:hypothetical protein
MKEENARMRTGLSWLRYSTVAEFCKHFHDLPALMKCRDVLFSLLRSKLQATNEIMG